VTRARIAARRTLLALALLAGGFVACESTAPLRDIRATFMDESGRPIPGAILYAEAADGDEAFAFTWAKAGEAGEVPRIAIRALKIPWRRGARLSLAGFAPGFHPAVLSDPKRSVPSDGVGIRLRAAAHPADAWNPELVRLAFPFEPGSALAESARDEAHAELWAAFRDAYAASPDSGGAPSGDLAPRHSRARKMLLNP
jgi:hypothetical protein